ncbi:hypothetical protein SSCG_03507 [Streptomyces clavuligerus]|nr:hypothetical protein SSCG_03507 [Streptomyces clavuligerus]
MKPPWCRVRFLWTCRASGSTVDIIRSATVPWVLRQRPSRPSASWPGSMSCPATRASRPTAFAALSPSSRSGQPPFSVRRMSSVRAGSRWILVSLPPGMTIRSLLRFVLTALPSQRTHHRAGRRLRGRHAARGATAAHRP